MFKLFKKQTAVKPTVEAAVAELPVTKSKYPQVVQDIHNEFFTAGENILAEANSLLSELEKKDVAKGKRLAALGFGKTREAVAAIETENKLATTKEIAELVLYYQQNYPNNKFITEKQVKEICSKYGLVCGETSLYKGFVPSEKMNDIERFKVKDSDKCIGILMGSGGGVWDEYIGMVASSDVFSFWNEDISRGDSATFNNRGRVKDYFSERIKVHFTKYESLKVQGLSGIGLRICAPIKDMDTRGMVLKGHILVKHIPDPIVLQPVNGGYLIVCAWGDEASDEIVVNQKMN